MTNEEKIDWLCRLRSYINGGIDMSRIRSHTQDKFLEVLTDVIEDLHALEQTRWIPVTEKLPKEFADVLVCTDAEEIFIASYLGKMNDGTDCFDDDDGMMWEGDVIAWQSLPKPYKKGGEQG